MTRWVPFKVLRVLVKTGTPAEQTVALRKLERQQQQRPWRRPAPANQKNA